MGINSECSCENKVLAEVEWLIPDIKCEGCADKLKTTLEEIKGVRVEQLKVDEKRIVLSYNTVKVSEQQLKEALNKAGFPVAA